jgi:hypothetical protein
MADPRSYPGAPRWVKVSGIVVGVVALLLAVLIHVSGGHQHIHRRWPQRPLGGAA